MKKTIVYKPDDKKYGKTSLSKGYCPKCNGIYKVKKLDKECQVNIGFKFITADTVFICSNCETLVIADLGELWKKAQEFYKQILYEQSGECGE